MRLSQIEILDYRVFRGFTWPRELLEFADLNLIYAPNGSGKSTIARMIRMAGGELELDDINASLGLEDGTSLVLRNGAVDPASGTLQIHVFDQDFRTQALDSLHGIRWSIGTAEVARQKKLDEISRKRAADIEAVEAIEPRVRKAEATFGAFLEARNTEIRELHEVIQPRANFGLRRVREGFEEVAQDESDLDGLSSEQLKIEERVLRDGTPRKGLAHLDWSAVVSSLGTIKSAAVLLAKRVVDRPSGTWSEIASDRWLAKGIETMQEHPDGDCPFCRQPVPGARTEHLEAAFDDSYMSVKSAVEDERQAISQALRTVKDLRLPIAGDLEPGCAEALALVVEEFDREVALVSLWLAEIDDLFEQRLSDLSTTPDLPVPTADFDLPTLQGAVNSLIDQHNEQLSEREIRRVSARDALIAEIYRRELPLYTKLKEDVRREKQDLESKREAIAESDKEVARLNRAMSDTADSAALMTEQLARYLGHGHLTVESFDGAYRILRDGEAVNEVSEGERTAITLIHFLQSLNDSDADRENGIVMIDDPVSSLDSSSIHSAFAFLTTAIYQADTKSVRGQIFIATHNFVFFRLLRDWSRHLYKGRAENEIDRPTRFYELRVEDGERRKARLVAMHRLLLRFNSEYHYLFSRLVKFDSSVDLLVGPTLARRLLEAFLAFKVPDREGDLRRQIDDMLDIYSDLGEEQQIRLRSLCNTGSHADRIPVLSRDLGPIDEVPGLVEAVLRFIETVDSEHYRRMTRLVHDASGHSSTGTDS